MSARHAEDRATAASIYVKPIPRGSCPESLLPVFEAFGAVNLVHIPRDPATGLPRTYCFIDFVERRSAEDAVRSLHGASGALIPPSPGTAGPVGADDTKLVVEIAARGQGREAVIVSCGSFNPVTVMHLRMLEVARDTLRELGWTVNAGVLSPVHDGYGKKGLAPAPHRVEMCRLALRPRHGTTYGKTDGTTDGDLSKDPQKSGAATARPQKRQKIEEQGRRDAGDGGGAGWPGRAMTSHRLPAPARNWIAVSDWESTRDAHVRTLFALRHFQDENPGKTVFLAAGADLVDSMTRPNVWREPELECLLSEFGVVVMAREGTDVEGVIHKSEVLTRHRGSLIPAKEGFNFSLSSTAIRGMCAAGHSLRYLTPDAVVDYIADHDLYTTPPDG